MLPQSQLKLASLMVSNNSKINSRIKAGYTYFGQMISHDMVPVTHPDGSSQRHIWFKLGLESLYGPQDSEGLPYRDGHKFKLTLSKEGVVDLPRDENTSQYTAIIPEPRNDENTIISQFHLFWLQFHNLLIDHHIASSWGEAKSLVTQLFQLLTLEDFLEKFLHPEVFSAYIKDGERYLGFTNATIPPEFALAAFRFGHSTVRDRYSIGGNSQKLGSLFRRHQPLTKEFQILWDEFFVARQSSRIAQESMLPDPWISFGMSTLEGPIHIAIKNLEAGIEGELPTGLGYVENLLRDGRGRTIRARFGLKPLTDLGILSDSSNPDMTLNSLPLWPYLLLENTDSNHGNGLHLGITASLICAETICIAIENANDSVREGGYDYQVMVNSLGQLGEQLTLLAQERSEGARVNMTDVLSWVVSRNKQN